MISQIFLAALVLWTHSRGWTDPVVVIDHWGGVQYKDVCVTPGDHIHQAWYPYENAPRVGYNAVLADGTKLVPDQMISNNVMASYPEMALLGADSVVMVWQEGYHFWFQVRDGDGSIVTPTTEFPVPPSSRVRYDMDCDSLKRIHLVCAQIESTNNEFVLYTVHGIDGTLLFADTLPDNSYYDPFIHIDGNSVHIKYESDNPWRTMYIQYDLEGNITAGPVMLFDHDLSTGHFASIQTDTAGDPYILIHESPEYQDPLCALYKLDNVTGDKLIDGVIIAQGVPGCSIDNDIPVFEPMPGDTSFYASWLRGSLFVDFCIIDQNGDFVEETYVAYDYTDEEIQQLASLRGTANQEGDFFAVWSSVDMSIPGCWIVFGVLDYDWVGLEEETSAGIQALSPLRISRNPFSGVVEFAGSGSELNIFDVSGRKVTTLSSSEDHFLWNGLSSSGAEAPPGAYFAVLSGGGERSVLRIVKLE